MVQEHGCQTSIHRGVIVGDPRCREGRLLGKCLHFGFNSLSIILFQVYHWWDGPCSTHVRGQIRNRGVECRDLNSIIAPR
jgi:hypothetical protein